jgi:hypothetical protein
VGEWRYVETFSVFYREYAKALSVSSIWLLVFDAQLSQHFF